jgi:hypothetical protein
MTADPLSTKPRDHGSPRKEYRTPSLRIYGNIREITQAVGRHGRGDGGTVRGRKRTAL